jgi:putative phosphoribosyl transferase
MLFRDRGEAAGLLAERLAPYRGRRPLILGFPRAGVLMARGIAESLEGDLDVLLVRRLPAPGRRELAVGAVAEDGTTVLRKRPPYAAEIPAAFVEEERREALAALKTRRALYTPRRPPACPEGRIAIVVDDGDAAEPDVAAALRSLREASPARLILATAVAPPGRVDACRFMADDVICLAQPGYFGSVSRFYMEFHEASDLDVALALRREAGSARSRAGGGSRRYG